MILYVTERYCVYANRESLSAPEMEAHRNFNLIVLLKHCIHPSLD